MNWTPTPDGWEAAPVEGCTASIMAANRHGGIKWRLTLTGRAGSALSAQGRLEAIIGQLGVEAESPKAGAERRS